MKQSLLLVAVVCLLCRATIANPPAIQLIHHDQTIDVMADGKLFTTYHFADDFILPYTRPFFWPVRAPDGTDLTADQAQTVKDHPHQRSIWIGHGDVNGADQWKVTRRPIQPKQRHIDFNHMNETGFDENLIWEDKDGQPMLNEIRALYFSVYPDGSRAIDVGIQLTAIHDEVTFGIGRDHGLFSIRLLPVIADQPQLLNSAGSTTDDAVSGKRADWCDESGQIDGKTYGAATFDAPDNLRHPPYWHAHSGERLAPDIFGPVKGKKNAELPDAGPLTISAGKSVTLRYRAIFHNGPAVFADLAQKYRDYTQKDLTINTSANHTAAEKR